MVNATFAARDAAWWGQGTACASDSKKLGGKLRGIFGEREFIGALFPGYLTTLGYAGFIPRSLDEALEKRATCASEPVSAHMNTDHIDVGEDFSDTQLAEILLHHRVLIVPIVDKGRVTGIVTREDFTRALAQRLLAVS